MADTYPMGSELNRVSQDLYSSSAMANDQMAPAENIIRPQNPYQSSRTESYQSNMMPSMELIGALEASSAMREAALARQDKELMLELTTGLAAGAVSAFAGGGILSLPIFVAADALMKGIAEDLGVLDQPPVATWDSQMEGLIGSAVHQFAYEGPRTFGQSRSITRADAQGYGEDIYARMQEGGFQGVEFGRMMQTMSQLGEFDDLSSLDDRIEKTLATLEKFKEFFRQTGMGIEEMGQYGQSLISAGTGITFGEMGGFISGIQNLSQASGIPGERLLSESLEAMGPWNGMGLRNIDVVTSIATNIANSDMVYRASGSQTAWNQAGGFEEVGLGYEARGAAFMADPFMLGWMGVSGAGGMDEILSGEKRPESVGTTLEGMSREDRLLARHRGAIQASQMPDQWGDAYVGQLLGGLERRDIDDPIAQSIELADQGIYDSPAAALANIDNYRARTDPSYDIRATLATAQGAFHNRALREESMIARDLMVSSAMSTVSGAGFTASQLDLQAVEGSYATDLLMKMADPAYAGAADYLPALQAGEAGAAGYMGNNSMDAVMLLRSANRWVSDGTMTSDEAMELLQPFAGVGSTNTMGTGFGDTSQAQSVINGFGVEDGQIVANVTREKSAFEVYADMWPGLQSGQLAAGQPWSERVRNSSILSTIGGAGRWVDSQVTGLVKWGVDANDSVMRILGLEQGANNVQSIFNSRFTSTETITAGSAVNYVLNGTDAPLGEVLEDLNDRSVAQEQAFAPGGWFGASRDDALILDALNTRGQLGVIGNDEGAGFAFTQAQRSLEFAQQQYTPEAMQSVSEIITSGDPEWNDLKRRTIDSNNAGAWDAATRGRSSGDPNERFAAVEAYVQQLYNKSWDALDPNTQRAVNYYIGSNFPEWGNFDDDVVAAGAENLAATARQAVDQSTEARLTGVDQGAVAQFNRTTQVMGLSEDQVQELSRYGFAYETMNILESKSNRTEAENQQLEQTRALVNEMERNENSSFDQGIHSAYIDKGAAIQALGGQVLPGEGFAGAVVASSSADLIQARSEIVAGITTSNSGITEDMANAMFAPGGYNNLDASAKATIAAADLPSGLMDLLEKEGGFITHAQAQEHFNIQLQPSENVETPLRPGQFRLTEGPGTDGAPRGTSRGDAVFSYIVNWDEGFLPGWSPPTNDSGVGGAMGVIRRFVGGS
ncbi:MAG: hypothetical protein WC455_09695 [Dehalococcoidia bacterium]